MSPLNIHNYIAQVVNIYPTVTINEKYLDVDNDGRVQKIILFFLV